MLTSNLLNGSFPWDLGLQLPKLKTFSVGGNQFSGPFPSSITNASGLMVLDIAINALSGPIPMNMGKLSRLQRLVFSNNSLGKVERVGLNFLNSLTNCTDLGILHLNDNSLEGILPSSIANLPTKLISLKLDGNYISGGIPEGLGNLINLQNLGLSQNMLAGVIPEILGKLTKLQGLYLSRNNFSGNIPSSVGDVTMLIILEMQENMLGGVIPVSLGSCRRLLKLDLSHNRLTGKVPLELLALSSLSLGLNLSQNQLSGPLPLNVGNLINLVSLDVSNNNLSEKLPYSLGACGALEVLNVHHNHFDGSIPESLESLTSIQLLDLSSNNFSGRIPASLANVPFLQYLNLSFNLLEGEVPNVGLFRNSTAFSVTGNKKLCGGVKSLKLPECHMEKPTGGSETSDISFHMVAGLLTTGYLCFALLVHMSLLHYCTRETQSPKSEVPSSEVSPLGEHYPKLSYTVLSQATDGFSPSSLIAMGRYSSVYQGILKYSEQAVAVKVLNLQEHGARKSFVAECEALKNIRHRNLVKIVTSCSGTDLRGNEFKALVYELMPNGCLEGWLHPNTNNLQEQKNLDLIQRLNVAIDVASVLNYLHHCCEVPVIHRDVKPSNILLDDRLCAHLGDFGSARSVLHPIDRCRQQRNLSNEVGIIGTVGYVALEFAMGGPVSTLVDVYSYGIVLLEMFSGKRPTDDMFIDDFCLHNYVKMGIPDQVLKITDPRLLSERTNVIHETAGLARKYTCDKMERCLALIFRIGLTCSAYLPSERMEISDALMGLQAIRDILLGVDETAIFIEE